MSLGRTVDHTRFLEPHDPISEEPCLLLVFQLKVRNIVRTTRLSVYQRVPNLLVFDFDLLLALDFVFHVA